jgi:hypothetical protein
VLEQGMCLHLTVGDKVEIASFCQNELDFRKLYFFPLLSAKAHVNEACVLLPGTLQTESLRQNRHSGATKGVPVNSPGEHVGA